jgi:hypothetical protein
MHYRHARSSVEVEGQCHDPDEHGQWQARLRGGSILRESPGRARSREYQARIELALTSSSPDGITHMNQAGEADARDVTGTTEDAFEVPDCLRSGPDS